MRIPWVLGAALLVALPTGGVLTFGKEAALGKADFAVDALASVVPGFPRARLPDAAPEGEDVLAREFTWTYHGMPYAWRVGFEPSDYARAVERGRTADPRAYGAYVTTGAEDPAVARVAAGLASIAESRGYDELERANLALAFVQSIAYVTDESARGIDDYAQLPIETLVEGRGDCEDTSILYASIAREMGLDATLLLLTGHMAAGVRVPFDVRGHAFDGYAYAETTRLGYRVGEVPPVFRGEEAVSLKVAPLAALDVALSPVAREWGWVVRVDVWNNGTARADGVNLYAGTEDDEGRWMGGFSSLQPLDGGSHATRWIWVDAPSPDPTRIRAVAWAATGEVAERIAVAPPVPMGE